MIDQSVHRMYVRRNRAVELRSSFQKKMLRFFEPRLT